jgi:5'-deoxynucleotidase YfbR-like HD superfamily hydrolase
MFEKHKLDEIKDVLEFAKHTDRMSYLIRYNTTPHLYPESVGNHSFQVAIITLFLYEKYKNKLGINFISLIKQALSHDLAESMEYVGDIPKPIKANNPALEKALNETEYRAIKELLGIEYVGYLEDFNACETLESILVNLADVISCLIYAESEIMKGNKYFERVKYESEERMVKFLEKLNASK